MNTTEPDKFSPLKTIVEVKILRNAIHACELGQQYARDALADHDAALGRTTLKNMRWAKSLETDIQKFGELQAILEQLIGDN